LGRCAGFPTSYTAARALIEESLAIWRALGDRFGIALALCQLGCVLGRQGHEAAARALLGESLALYREGGDKGFVASVLHGFALRAVAQGQPQHAVRLLGAADALRQALGTYPWPAERAECRQALETLRSALGEEAVATMWATGQAMTLEQAIAHALEVPPPA
jgi:hypothetical protein